jgi:hypothetical protein
MARALSPGPRGSVLLLCALFSNCYRTESATSCNAVRRRTFVVVRNAAHRFGVEDMGWAFGFFEQFQ